MKRFLHALWGIVRSNLVLKIIALLFAIVLWSYVLSETNPPRERVMNDIPVRYQNMEELKAKGLAISGSLSDVLDSVDIRVEINQSDLKYLNDQNVKATIDLSTINGAGEPPLEINATTQYGKVLEVSPKEVTLNIDSYVTRIVPVNISVIGSVADGYYAGEPEITDVVSISGAKGDVEKVTSASYIVNLQGLTEGYNKSVEVELLDDEGQIVANSLFSESVPSVIVNLSVLPQKTVPVDVVNSIQGQDNLASGYEIIDITCIPETVSIVGNQSVLSGINTMQLVPYSVSGASEDVVVLLDYETIEGVTVLSSDKAQVNVTIREVTSVKEFSEVKIQQKNIANGLEARISENMVDVTVIAGVSKVTTLDKSQIVPYIDLEGLEPGEYSLDVKFEVPEGFVAENFSSNMGTVTVTVKRG